jgi:hypothetical protein
VGGAALLPQWLHQGLSVLRRWRWPLLAPLLALVTVGIIWRHRLAWGDVATWLLMIVSLLAFLAAVAAGYVAYRLLLIESHRDRQAEEERKARAETEKSQQAGKVAGWYGSWEADQPDPLGPPEYEAWGAILRNGSDLPVFDLRVSFCVDPGTGASWRSGVRWTSSADDLKVLPPGDMRAQIRADIRTQELQRTLKPDWLISIEFTDAAGVRWVREPRGGLVPLDGAAAG